MAFSIGALVARFKLDVTEWRQGITTIKLDQEQLKAAIGQTGVTATQFGEILKKYGIGTANDAAESFKRLKREHDALSQAYQSGIITQGQYQTAAKKIDEELRRLEGTQKAVATGGGFLASAFGQVAAGFTAASLATRVIEGALSAAKNLVTSSIKGAIEEEASERRLAVALEIRGGATRRGLADLKDFAKAQSLHTTYTHEEIEASMAMLASLHKLDDEGLKKTEKGIIGLAAVLGPDEGLRGATMMLNRALEGNFTGLRRVGIVIDETLPKGQQLAQLQEKLAALYPRATAELDTMGGKVKNAGKSWDEIKESIGAFILKATQARAGLADLAVSLQQANGQYGQYADKINYAYITQNAHKALLHSSANVTAELMVALRDLNAAYGKTHVSLETLIAAYRKGPEAFDKFIAMIRAVNKIFDEQPGKIGPVVNSLTDNFKILGIESEGNLIIKFNLAKRTLDDYLASGGKAPGVLKALKDAIGSLGIQLGKTEDFQAFKSILESLGEFQVKAHPLQAELATIAKNQTLVNLAYKAGAIDLYGYIAAMAYYRLETSKSVLSMPKQSASAWEKYIDSLIKGGPKITTFGQKVGEALGNIDDKADETSKVWETAIGTMMSTMVQFGDGTGSILSGAGKAWASFAKTAIAAIEMQALAQMAASAKAIAWLKKESIAKWVADAFSKLGIFGLPLAAAGFAIINALFAKVLKFEKGYKGWLNQPTMVLMAEKEPEYVDVTPMSKGGMAVAATGQGAGGMTINISGPLIHTTGVSRRDLEAAGPELVRVINRNLRGGLALGWR